MWETAEKSIHNSLARRIPLYKEVTTETDEDCVRQQDIYGAVDAVILTPSERMYCLQKKSRNTDADDLCFEFRAFYAGPQNLQTGQQVTIGGAHRLNSNCMLTPKFSNCDLVAYYLPKTNATRLFNRFYLELLFAEPETWNHTTGIFMKNKVTFNVFFNCDEFTELYLQTVKDATVGKEKLHVNQTLSSSDIGRYRTRNLQRHLPGLGFSYCHPWRRKQNRSGWVRFCTGTYVHSRIKVNGQASATSNVNGRGG